MSFWDDPRNWPGQGAWPATPGETIEGTITRMELQQSRYGRNQLVVELDGDGVKRWCNGRLWRTLADARVDVGDRVRVTRGHDEPVPGGQKPASTWVVERLQPTPATARAAGYGQAPQAAQQPQWAAQAPQAPPQPQWGPPAPAPAPAPAQQQWGQPAAAPQPVQGPAW